MKINIKMKLLSPLAHFSDERMGTMQINRTNKFEYNGEFMDIPVYSGNAFRGILRRIAMNDYLERINIKNEGINDKLYYMLFSGGTLTSGSRYNDLSQKRKLREMCPALSLLGSAIGDTIIEGKMKSPIFRPICQETEKYTGIKSDTSFYDMLEDVFYTRKDDLKSVDYNIVENTEDKKKNDNPIQMKYEMQCLSTGTELIGNLIIENDREIEQSCLFATLEKFKENPFIGGKSATGHGEVEIQYDNFSNSELYYNYLEEHKQEIRQWIREMEEKL